MRLGLCKLSGCYDWFRITTTVVHGSVRLVIIYYTQTLIQCYFLFQLLVFFNCPPFTVLKTNPINQPGLISFHPLSFLPYVSGFHFTVGTAASNSHVSVDNINTVKPSRPEIVYGALEVRTFWYPPSVFIVAENSS